MIGAVTSLALGGVAFVWAVVKSVAFVLVLLGISQGSEDIALVKLFEAIDVILIGTVLLLIGLGLWELFIGDLDLPPSLTVASFEELKAKIATTLLLVLVVRFLESLVSGPGSTELLELGIAVTLVGALLLALANSRPSRRGNEQGLEPVSSSKSTSSRNQHQGDTKWDSWT